MYKMQIQLLLYLYSNRPGGGVLQYFGMKIYNIQKIINAI